MGVKGGRGGREDSEGGREGQKRRKGGRMEGGRETNYNQLTTLCVFGTMVSYHMYTNMSPAIPPGARVNTLHTNETHPKHTMVLAWYTCA